MIHARHLEQSLANSKQININFHWHFPQGCELHFFVAVVKMIITVLSVITKNRKMITVLNHWALECLVIFKARLYSIIY